MASILNTAGPLLGQFGLVRAVKEGQSRTSSLSKFLVPFTALQCKLSRYIAEKIERRICSSPSYEKVKSAFQQVLLKNYQKCEKPLHLIQYTSHQLATVSRRLAHSDPTPFSGAIALILADFSDLARDCRKVLSFHPKSEQALAAIERIANKEIIQFLETQCKQNIAKLNAPRPAAAALPQVSGENVIQRVYRQVTSAIEYTSNAVNQVAERVFVPVKKATYETIPDKAQSGVNALLGTARQQLQSNCAEIARKATFQATNLLTSKALHFAAFAAVNAIVGKTVQFVSKNAIRLWFHTSQSEEIESYSSTTTLALYNVYLFCIFASYTARIAAWRQQRVMLQGSAHYIRDVVKAPVEKTVHEITTVIEALSNTFKQTLETAGGLVDIDFAPAFDAFKQQCKKELSEIFQ